MSLWLRTIRVYIDYKKLNFITSKDQFPLFFLDQMLERLAGLALCCFLDGYSTIYPIPIVLKTKRKLYLHALFGTYAFRKMPFGLCNAPIAFQMCMILIFFDLAEHCLEIFMDDFFIYRDSFEDCLTSLRKVLRRWEDKHLILNWEKHHFIAKRRTVLGHIILS